MSEFRTIVLGQKLIHEGFLDVEAFWNELKEYALQHGYSYTESSHREDIHKTGKNISLIANLERGLAEFLLSRIVLRFRAIDISPQTIKRNNRTISGFFGRYEVEIDAFLVGTREGRFTEKSIAYYFQRIGELLSRQKHLEQRTIAHEDVDIIRREIRGAFELHAYHQDSDE